jgi:Uma2 family endonuclease
MPMAAPPHNACMTKTDRWLNKVFASGCYVRNQQALNVGTKNDPGPDFAVVPGTEDDYADRQPTTALLVVEVADSSFETDTLVKPHLYAQAGVPEYWVIELNERRLHVYRDPMADESAPRGFRYASIAVLGETDGIAPQAAQDHVVVVADLLPKE